MRLLLSTALSTPLGELGLFGRVNEEKLEANISTFNSPRGIRVVWTEPGIGTSVWQNSSFNSPRGIRVVWTS